VVILSYDTPCTQCHYFAPIPSCLVKYRFQSNDFHGAIDVNRSSVCNTNESHPVVFTIIVRVQRYLLYASMLCFTNHYSLMKYDSKRLSSDGCEQFCRKKIYISMNYLNEIQVK